MRRDLHSLRVLIVTLSGAVPLGGCGPDSVVKTTTLELADQVDLLNQRVQEYQTVLEESSARRLDRLASEGVDLDRLEYAANERLEVWKLAGSRGAVDLLEGIENIAHSGVEAERAFRTQLQRERAALQATQTRLRWQHRTLASLSEQLRSLAEERDLQSQVDFLIGYGQDVSDGLETLREELEKVDEAQSADDRAAGG